MIRALRTITAKDLRQRLRDKSFFLLGILTPLALAFVLNLVFGDLSEGELEVTMGVVDADGSPVSGQLAGNLLGLDGNGGIEATALDQAADPEAELDERTLDAVVVIPAGFGAGVTSAQAPEITVLENPDRPVQAGVVESIVEGVTTDIERTRLLAAAGGQLGVEPGVAPPATDVAFTQEWPGGQVLDMTSRLMAGMAIMFVFFTVGFGVTTLLEERENGTLSRLLAAPIPRNAILGAKALVSYTLGLLATMILFIAATVLMGAEWGSWLGVLALVLTACLTAVAMMAIVAGLAKRAEGAGAVQSIIAVGLALLGGSWFPVSGEGVLGMLARATPHFWFLEGLEDLAGASSWTVVWPSVVALGLIAVLAGVPAAVLLRRKLTP
ncbi:MAG TPA: ABC transporter permease [Jiangellaceae bacterium]